MSKLLLLVLLFCVAVLLLACADSKPLEPRLMTVCARYIDVTVPKPHFDGKTVGVSYVTEKQCVEYKQVCQIDPRYEGKQNCDR